MYNTSHDIKIAFPARIRDGNRNLGIGEGDDWIMNDSPLAYMIQNLEFDNEGW